MTRDWRRFFVWLNGAVGFVMCYAAGLTALHVNFSDKFGYRLLLSISGLAATMVGGTAATLVYDWMRNGRWKQGED